MGTEHQDSALEHRLASLVEVTHTLVTASDPDAILNRVIDTAIALVHADSGFLMLLPREARELAGASVVAAVSQTPQPEPASPFRQLDVRVARNFDRETISTEAFAFSRGVIERAIATHSPVLVEDAQREIGLAERESVMRYNLRAALVAPLLADGHLIGLVYLDNRLLSNAFTRDDLTLVTAVANIAATLLERARAFAVIEAQSAELRERLATITEQEARLRQAEKLAAVGRLAAGVAHEINNPLSVIQGSIELLLPRAGAPDMRDDLLSMKREVHQIAQIVAALLDYSRPRRLSRSPIDVGDFVREVADAARLGLPRSAISIDVAAALTVSLDQVAMRQVLDNLLRNAVDAILGDPFVRIAVRVLLCEDARALAGRLSADRRAAVVAELALTATWVVITVADNGAGIPPENLERIFEPFFTTKVVGRGTGLGLAISREIVRAHGGLLEVESRVGSGTTFMLFFPETATRGDSHERR